MAEANSLSGNDETLDIATEIGCIWPIENEPVIIDFPFDFPTITPEVIGICGTPPMGGPNPHVPPELETGIYTITEDGTFINGDGEVIDPATTEPFASMSPEFLTGIEAHAKNHEGGVTISIGEQVPAGAGKPQIDADGNPVINLGVMVPGITITDASGNLLGAHEGTDMHAFLGVVGAVASTEIQIGDYKPSIDLSEVDPNEMLYTQGGPATLS